jgi:hypothetical protein
MDAAPVDRCGEKRLIDLLESGKTLEEAKGILGIR